MSKVRWGGEELKGGSPLIGKDKKGESFLIVTIDS